MGVTVDLADLTLKDQNMIIIPYDSTRYGHLRDAGVIGYALFSRFVVEIDDLSELLKVDGKKVSLDILMDGKVLEVGLKLRRLI